MKFLLSLEAAFAVKCEEFITHFILFFGEGKRYIRTEKGSHEREPSVV